LPLRIILDSDAGCNLCVCLDNGSDPVSSAGFHAVTFSYGNTNASMEIKDDDAESSFVPNFPVPASLLHNLVSNMS